MASSQKEHWFILIILMRRLYKYFSERKWAEKFLEGEILFRSLAYFRDYEDQEIRGDQNEGSAIYDPVDGLVITNHTQGTTFVLPGYSFESAARQDEIFVFCLSQSLKEEMRQKFGALVCVEIFNIATFCKRVVAALPSNATFPGAKGHARLGNRVEYYYTRQGGSPLWALPDKIAISKINSYAWQKEFRLAFSLTNAFDFERVDTRLVRHGIQKSANPSEHHCYPVKAQDLSDICRLHEFHAEKSLNSQGVIT